MTDPDARSSRRHRAGFSLVEVLGAVAILGLSYIVLATSAIQGLRMIGQSQRRIEASLLADQTLAEIEIAAEIGQLIDVRYEEREAGPFTIDVEVLDMAEAYEPDTVDGQPQDLVAFLSAEANGPYAPYRDTNLLLGFLREVHITVHWRDGANEIEVTRTAYIYDQQASIDHEQETQQLEQQLTVDGTRS